MKTIHDISGILRGVEILSAKSNGEALVSKLTIDQGPDGVVRVPYFGPMNNGNVKHLQGKCIRFIKKEPRFFPRKVYQSLEWDDGGIIIESTLKPYVDYFSKQVQ